MIDFSKKRIYSLLGSPRSGKDTVAKYLQESRNFVTMAFGDKIKEQFGISIEDFELAKVSGDIDKIRKDLWDFSTSKIKQYNDPAYFIRSLMDDAISEKRSVVITDIRTPLELSAICKLNCNIKKVFNVIKGKEQIYLDNNMLEDSKLHKLDIEVAKDAGYLALINNVEKQSYKFIDYLKNFFFIEDIINFVCFNEDLSDKQKLEKKLIISKYIQQFDIREVV